MGLRIPDAYGPGERILPPYLLFANGKLVQIKKKFYDLKNSNVAYAGSTVLTLSDGTWQKSEFPELIGGDVSEVLFVKENHIYILIHTAGATLEFLKLFIWENESFVELLLEGPTEKYLNDGRVPQVGVAGGETTDGDTILYQTNKAGDITLYTLQLRNRMAQIEETGTISSCINTRKTEAMLADVFQDTLIITTGLEHSRHRESFFWDDEVIFLFDLKHKITKKLNVHSTDILSCGSGPTSSFFNPKTGTWLLAGHTERGDVPGGTLWLLTDVLKNDARLTWKEYDRHIADGEHVFDNGTVFTVTKGKVTRLDLSQL